MAAILASARSLLCVTDACSRSKQADPIILFVLKLEGGAGKSFLTILLVMLLSHVGRAPRVVSIDRLHGAAPFLAAHPVTTSDLSD